MSEFCNPYSSYLDACELEIMADGKSFLRTYAGGEVDLEIEGVIRDVKAIEGMNSYGEPNGNISHTFSFERRSGDKLKYFTSKSSWREKETLHWEYVGKEIKSLGFEIKSRDQITFRFGGRSFNRVK